MLDRTDNRRLKANSMAGPPTKMQRKLGNSDEGSDDNLVGSNGGLVEHGQAAGSCLGFLRWAEVQSHCWNGRVICQATSVLGILEVDVALLAPGAGPRIPHDPIWCWCSRVEASGHHTMILLISCHAATLRR